MNDADTGLVDKSGKPIYVGDTLQMRLGKFAKKSGGATNVRVIRAGKRIKIIGVNEIITEHSGRQFGQHEANFTVIVDREIMR